MYELPAKLSESNSAGYLQVRFKVWPAWTTCCVPFMLSSGTFNFDPELDPRKTKKKKTLTMTNHPVPNPLTFMMLYWKGKAKKRGCPHYRTHSFALSIILLSWLRTRIIFHQNYSGKKAEMKAIHVLVDDFSLRLFTERTREESSGPCSYTSNQGSVPSSTAGCISLGNTTMAASSMGRAEVSHFHGKSHVLTSKILNSYSNNLLQSWNSFGRNERGLRIFPSWLKVTALLPTVPH